MLATLLFPVLFAAATPAATLTAPLACEAKADPNPLKALDTWLKLYRKGKIDYRSPEPLGKKSIALKYKVRKPNDLGNPTWAGDLELILKVLAGQNDAEAARAIAEVAAVGLDPKGKYSYAMAPYSVRSAALDALETFSSKGAKDTLAAGARGEWKVRKNASELRAAALLGLGRVGDPAYADVIKGALEAPDVVTRLHAVQALAHIADTDSQKALIGVL